MVPGIRGTILIGLGATSERLPLRRALPGRSRSFATSERKTFREEHG